MREELFLLGLLGFITSFSQELDRGVFMIICSSLVIMYSCTSPRETKKKLKKENDLIVIEVK